MSDLALQVLFFATETTKEAPTKADTNVPYTITIAIALVSSAGFWGVVTWLLGVRERRRKDQQDAEDREEKKRKAAEEEKKDQVKYQDLLAAAQAEAQRTALESANARYAGLHEDYTKCLEAIQEVRQALFLTLDSMELVLSKFRGTNSGTDFTAKMSAEEMADTRAHVREARAALFKA